MKVCFPSDGLSLPTDTIESETFMILIEYCLSSLKSIIETIRFLEKDTDFTQEEIEFCFLTLLSTCDKFNEYLERH